MVRRTSLILAFLLGAMLLPGLPGTLARAAEIRELVLVSSNTTDIKPQSLAAVRRTFLGIQNSNTLNGKPIVNQSDPLLYQVFLQKVVYMSARHYERRLISNLFRSGDRRPPEIKDEQQLVVHLRQHRGTVSYMWANKARSSDGIKVVQVLWRGPVE